jgi:quinol monooxygenase YgiN
MTLAIVARLETSSKTARSTLIDALSKAKDYAAEKEPGTLKYCIFIPQKDDDTTIYMMDESVTFLALISIYLLSARYTDTTALDEHMKAPPIADLMELLTSSPELLSSPMKMYKLEPSYSYTRPNVDERSDRFFVFGSLTYTEPKYAEVALNGFGGVGKASEANEPGTLAYAVLRDPEEKCMVRTIEAYESEEYLWDPHAKSAAVQDNIKVQGDTRIGRDLVFLKKVTGYFYR